MSTGAVVVANTLAAQLVALSDQAVADVNMLTAQASTLAITDADSMAQGNALFRRIDQLLKDITERRLEMTRPIDTLKTKILEAERSATVPLTNAKQALGQRIHEVDKRLREEREAAERKAREDAERIAAEQRRKAEADRKVELAKWRAAEDAKRKEAELFGGDAEPSAAPPPVAAVPVVAVIIPPPAAPLPKSAVRTSTHHRTVIDDRAALIAAACKDLGRIYGKQVLTIDERAVDELVKAGVAVPGSRSEAYERIGSLGSRG